MVVASDNPGIATQTQHTARGDQVSQTKKFDGVLAELREQGLNVTVCSPLNETWYIKDDGLFTGYIASGDELLELKSANRLNMLGLKSLG